MNDTSTTDPAALAHTPAPDASKVTTHPTDPGRSRAGFAEKRQAGSIPAGCNDRRRAAPPGQAARTHGAGDEGEGIMRINVYSQELTDEVIQVEKRANTGLVYHAVQMILHSSDRLHHPPDDDDRSAVTFWLPKSASRREALAKAFERMAGMVRLAPPETGLD